MRETKYWTWRMAAGVVILLVMLGLILLAVGGHNFLTGR
jgi:hypothetical protein